MRYEAEGSALDKDYPHLRIGALDLAEFLDGMPGQPDCGALTIFTGTIRDQHLGRAVSGIRYEAHLQLAERRLAEIEQEAAARFGAQLRVAHAVGELQVGDTSVVILARAGHRGEAFAAARWAIDTIKLAVPIWKEERYLDGDSQFLEGEPLQPVDPRQN